MMPRSNECNRRKDFIPAAVFICINEKSVLGPNIILINY